MRKNLYSVIAIVMCFFCVDVNAQTAGNCGIIAGEANPATATVCATGTAQNGEPEQGSVDVTAVFGAAGPAGTASLNQNYVVVDPTNNDDIVTVASTAVLDLSSFAVGEQACVYSAAYTQETLDLITAFLDDNFFSGDFCVPIFGPCLEDVVPGVPLGTQDLSGFLNAINGIFEFIGFDFTRNDIQTWCETQILTIPTSSIPVVGPLVGDITVDLTTIPGLSPTGFCCDFSDVAHCITVTDCSIAPACELTAVTAAAPACAADGSYSVVVTVTGTDASVTLDDANSNETSQAVAGTVTFTYPAGTAYNITVTDTEAVCAFGPFAGADPACPVNVAGCTDACSPNFNPAATTDDGSCQAQVLGCTDPAAANYDINALCDDGSCVTNTATVPTLSEWGLITLALVLMSYGTLAMAGAGAFAGTNNVNTPIGFQLPFNAAILRKAFMFTILLAAIGYTMSIVLFGAIFFSDIVGVAIAGPVFAYLTHLLYLAEKNK